MNPEDEKTIADMDVAIGQLQYLMKRPLEQKINLVRSGHMDQIFEVCIYLIEQYKEIILYKNESNEEARGDANNGTTGIQDPQGN